jgi:CBS domain containing-hemolysin-like protein
MPLWGAGEIKLEPSQLTTEFLIFAVCLGLSGFFSSSETALTALTEAKARQLMEDKRRGTRALQLWLNRPNRVLTAILIGNNIVNVFTASYATLIAQKYFNNVALSLATAVTTVAILIVGEITPKTFAKHNAAKIAPAMMTILLPVYWVTLPATWLFVSFSHAIVKLTGGEITRTGPFVTEEDIAFLIRLGNKQGVLEEDEGELLESVFEFGETMVKEVMVPRTGVSALDLDASLDGVVNEAQRSGHSRIPVYEDTLDNVKGIFHAKDLLKILPDNSDGEFNIDEYLRPAFFVPELMKISDLLKELQRRKTHLAIVVDEYGGTAGLVTLEDILEELVGEIHDEYDDAEEERAFRQIDDEHFLANGHASIYEMGEAMGEEFPADTDYESVGGFLIAKMGSMPKKGAEVVYRGWRFVVLDADDRRVLSVSVERLPESARTESGKIIAFDRAAGD